MPDLTQSLQGRDLGHLRIVADLWGLEFDAPDARIGLQRLRQLILDSELIEEVIEALPEEAHFALVELLKNEGRLAWATFIRQYGIVREMGAARRDRERPFENANASSTEALWYRGLVSRAFFDTPDGPQEFAYIPDDLLDLMPATEIQHGPLLGRPASPLERAYPILADDTLVDDACTLLAALRIGLTMENVAPVFRCGALSSYPLTPEMLQPLLESAGLLDDQGIPLPGPTREFLEIERGEALSILERTWLHSSGYNELRLLPGLSVEGKWQNDPLKARQAILDFLSTLSGSSGPGDMAAPEEQPYWSMTAFITAVRQFYPDYQRPAGDYDSWYLRDLQSGEYLRGFTHWDAVEGELIRFMIAGPLHWLGIMDLAAPNAPESGESIQTTAFRFSAWADRLLKLSAPSGLPLEEERFTARSDGRVRIPIGAPRAIRYQIARFCEWDGFSDGFYRYRLTPSSLERAREQGLNVHHLFSLMRRYSTAVPPSLFKALERWEDHGSEAQLENLMVLRLKNPEILDELRASRTARFLGDSLGPAAVVVRPGAWEKVLAALVEMGYLGEIIEPER